MTPSSPSSSSSSSSSFSSSFSSSSSSSPEHVVVFGQRGHRGVEKRSADVELDVLGTLGLERHAALARHDGDSGAAADAAVQIAATSPDATAAAATDASNVQHPLLDGEGVQRGKGPLYQGGEIRFTYLECLGASGFVCVRGCVRAISKTLKWTFFLCVGFRRVANVCLFVCFSRAEGSYIQRN